MAKIVYQCAGHSPWDIMLSFRLPNKQTNKQTKQKNLPSLAVLLKDFEVTHHFGENTHPKWAKIV